MSFYHLRVTDTISLEIDVDDQEADEISSAIRSGAYKFPASYGLLPAVGRTGQCVVDLGAHVGTFTLYAAALGYQVIAVEASPQNASHLRRSIDRNEFSNVQLINRAISDRSETIEFIQAGPYGLRANPLLHDPTIQVPAATAEEILAGSNCPKPFFIKMDIEGSEVRAVRGMRQLLSGEEAPVILYESNGHTLHYFDETPNHLMELLEQAGYACYLVENRRLFPVRSFDLQPECTVDYLATKSALAQIAPWVVEQPLSDQEIQRRILRSCVSSDAHNRAYIGRSLADAPAALFHDLKIHTALDQLAQDSVEDVRRSVGWWDAKRKTLPVRASHSGRAFGRLRGWLASVLRRPS